MVRKKKSSVHNDNLITLLVISFVFITSCGLVLSKKEIIPEVVKAIVEKGKLTENSQLPPIPTLNEKANYFPVVSAQGALAIDLNSGISIYEKNPDVTLLPASTTKIVTALVAMDSFADNQILTVDGLRIPGQSMGLVSGEKITAKDLLEGLLIYSANDAAEVLAENYCVNAAVTEGKCGREYFIEAMNKKAQELHLTNTHFVNPSGFDSPKQYTTTRDLIRVAKIAMQIPRFSQIVNKKEVTVASIDGKTKHRLTSTNKLLGSVPGVLGVKTGWTENARENLVTYIERDGHKIMIAVLGSQDRFGETKELIDWIFANYEWKEVVVKIDN